MTFEVNHKTEEDKENEQCPELIAQSITFNEPLINELLPLLAFMADAPDHEQLPQDFYTRKNLQASAVGFYGNMLNRHLHTNSTFIFDLDLTESIYVSYTQKTSRVYRQDLLAEIHRRTEGTLLTSYQGGLLFTVKNEVNHISTFDLIQVSVAKREIKGTQDSYLIAIKAFLQDYMYQTLVQRRANQKQQLENNIALPGGLINTTEQQQPRSDEFYYEDESNTWTTTKDKIDGQQRNE